MWGCCWYPAAAGLDVQLTAVAFSALRTEKRTFFPGEVFLLSFAEAWEHRQIIGDAGSLARVATIWWHQLVAQTLVGHNV